MNKQLIQAFLLSTLLQGLAAAAIPPIPEGVKDAKRYLPPVPMEGAENHLDVVYLPERLAGTWEDRWITMNIHVPEQSKGPHPCLIFIHGGGYGGGDKDFPFWSAGPGSELRTRKRALEQGYVVVNLNYILGYGESSQPQVFWDFRSAVRFLRSHADDYRIDPGRIAAWGFSAGGWLASSAGFSESDDTYEFRANAAQSFDHRLHRLEVAYDAPSPPYGAHSSRLNCIIADFWSVPGLLRPHSPPLLTFVGEGAEHVNTKLVAGGRLDALVFLGEKCKGKNSLHVPPITSPVQALDGSGDSILEDQAFLWLDQELCGKNRRTLPPEARPNARIFSDSTTVSLIAASSDTTIYYTTDSSDPTSESQRYTGPFALDTDTTVKAIAVRKNEAASGIMTATYTKGTPLPVISAPATIKLPTATIGQPYSVQFVAEGATVWNMTGPLGPYGYQPGHGWIEPGLKLDPQTGCLSGTPLRAGTFTIQIQAARGYLREAGARIYLLTVRQSATDTLAPDSSRKETHP